MKRSEGPVALPVEIGAIEAARSRIAPFVVATPVLPFPGRDGVYVKAESLQVTGSFKVRGASNLISTRAGAQGVVTASSGNHGQAVAYVAARRGIPATVVVPEDVPPVKADGILRWGGRLIRHGRTSDERIDLARRLAAAGGLLYVPPFDDPDILAGQGTIGLEILEQLPAVAAIAVPVSGGGLIGGVASAVKQRRPDVEVIGVEPAAVPRFARSRAEGRPVQLPFAATVADGLRVQEPVPLTWMVSELFVDRFVPVDDEAILRAIRALAVGARLVVEPAGAASFAAVEAMGVEGPVVAVLSGGNIDPELLASVLHTS